MPESVDRCGASVERFYSERIVIFFRDVIVAILQQASPCERRGWTRAVALKVSGIAPWGRFWEARRRTKQRGR